MRALFGESSIISYLPLDEQSGSTAFDASGNGRTGAYTAVTLGQAGIGDGRTCPLFGAGSVCNWYSTSLRDAFNPSEGTLLQWFRVSGVGIWTDAVQQRTVTLAAVLGTNQVLAAQTGVNNQFSWQYAAGGVAKTISTLTLGGRINWIATAMTWSVSQDQFKAYVDGQQVETTLTGLGTWSGQLVSSNTVIGALNTSATEPWSGLIAHVLLLNRAAKAAEVAIASSWL